MLLRKTESHFAGLLSVLSGKVVKGIKSACYIDFVNIVLNLVNPRSNQCLSQQYVIFVDNKLFIIRDFFYFN